MWQSEVRINNPGSTTMQVNAAHSTPYGNVTCTTPSPIDVPARGMRQVRSVGCRGGAAGVDVILDDTATIYSVITNIAGTPQTACCLAGYTQMIPIVQVRAAYANTHAFANLQEPGVGCQNLGRHKIGIGNPGQQPAAINFRLFDATGLEIAASPGPKTVNVPAGALVQVNDVLPQVSGPITCVTITGWFRYEVTSDAPVYVYDSYVDNATNDATFIVSKP